MAMRRLSKARKKLDACPGCGEPFTRNDHVAAHFRHCQQLQTAVNDYLEARA